MRLPLTKALCLAVLTFSGIYIISNTEALGRFDSDVRRYLRPWPRFASLLIPTSFLTAAFTETTVATALFLTIFLGASCQYFERIWGTYSLAKYLALISIVPTFVSWLVLYFLHENKSAGSMRWHPIGGGVSLYVGMVVALKQALPLHVAVVLGGLVHFKFKYIVMPVLIFFSIIGAIHRPEVLISCWTSLVVSWWYLRFIKQFFTEEVLPDGGATALKGDKSNAFTFAKFFYPQPVTTVMEQITLAIFQVLVKLGVIKLYDQDQVEASNQQAQSTQPLDFESQRRRTVALNLLGGL